MKVFIGGKKVEKSYEEICHLLGMRPDEKFVDVLADGTISFTLGKPDEIALLYQRVIYAGMRPDESLGPRLSVALEKEAVESPVDFDLDYAWPDCPESVRREIKEMSKKNGVTK